MTRRAALGFMALLATVLVTAPFALAQVPDEYRSIQWNLDAVKVEGMRSYGRGAGAAVGVLSTGIDPDHPDLVGQTSGGRNFLTPSSTPNDQNGLGTHISGIVAALTDNGEGIASIAPEAKIMPVKALDDMRRGNGNTFINALDYTGTPADGIPIKVVLFTLPLNWDASFDPDLQRVINNIVSRGVLVVTGATPTDHFGEAPVIRVAGLDRGNVRTLDSGDPGATFGISAPAEGIMSTWSPGLFQPGDYREENGIDQAAAHVAGAAAVLMGKGLNAGQTAAVLLSSAQDLGTPGPDATYGFGALDLTAAARLAATPPPAPTPPTTKKTTDTTAPKDGGTPAPPSVAPAPTASTLGPVSPGRNEPPNPFTGPEQPAELPANALELQDDGGGSDDRPWGLLAIALAGTFLSFGGLSRTMLKMAAAPPPE